MEVSLRGARIRSSSFALEGYAYEVENPGSGCAGVRAAHATSTSAATPSKPSTSTATSTIVFPLLPVPLLSLPQHKVTSSIYLPTITIP